MKIRFLSLAISLVLVFTISFALSGCGESSTSDGPKLGLICLHDENSTYDKNFIDAASSVCEELGVELLIKTNIPEGQECYDASAELAELGCTVIFADSFGHEDYIAQAAREFPDIEFCHATGTQAHTVNLENFHNAFASIYEGRYLAGVAAGLKLNEMIENGDITTEEAKMGYVGAFTYAEVMSGYTAFYLGAKSRCPSVTMDVSFTGSWYDETSEKEAANSLIDGGCVLISQHADSMGAPTACENAGIPNVTYNGSLINACPNTSLISSRINWKPYFNYILTSDTIDTDWVGSLKDGSVEVTEVNKNVAAENTENILHMTEEYLNSGEISVFDTSTFTVKGKHLKSYMADVDSDADYTPDTEVIEDGVFMESKFRAAPYFDLQVDGINLINTKL